MAYCRLEIILGDNMLNLLDSIIQFFDTLQQHRIEPIIVHFSILHLQEDKTLHPAKRPAE